MSKKIVCFDLETTGTSTTDSEILQISMVDENLKVLFNDYIKPVRTSEWPSAMAVNGITPEMVKDKKTLNERKDEIINIFNAADIVIGFNSDRFDIPFIENALDFTIKAKRLDVMTMAMKEFGLYSKIPVSLADVAGWFGIVNEKAHDSLGDTVVTMKIFNRMAEESKKPRLAVIYTFDDGKMFYTKDLAYEHAERSGAKITDIKYLENGKVIEKPTDRSKYRVGGFLKGVPGKQIDKFNTCAYADTWENPIAFEDPSKGPGCSYGAGGNIMDRTIRRINKSECENCPNYVEDKE